MVAWKEGDNRVGGISFTIRVVPDFPKPGIMFQDITTLLLNTIEVLHMPYTFLS